MDSDTGESHKIIQNAENKAVRDLARMLRTLLGEMSLSDFLGSKPWFMGERPCTLDASAFGLLANILWCPIESPLKERSTELGNLVQFCERIDARYYGRSPAG